MAKARDMEKGMIKAQKLFKGYSEPVADLDQHCWRSQNNTSKFIHLIIFTNPIKMNT